MIEGFSVLKQGFFLVSLILLICTVNAQSEDLVGVVNVGDDAVNNNTEINLFTVSINENSGEIPITLGVYNLSSNFLVPNNNIQTQDVIVFCDVITPYTEGDTTVTFRTAILTSAKPSHIIDFDIGKQGRAIEIQCYGYSNAPDSLYQNSTKGITGFIAVIKSPVVGLCQDMIIVPYLLDDTYTQEITLQLSEEVIASEVNISCEVDSLYQGDDFLSLEFQDQLVSVGTTEINMRYTVLAKNLQPVLVRCSGQSVTGLQYLRNESGSSAMFGFAETSVQFVPFISNVASTYFKSFLILGSTFEEGQVAFSCYITAVNDSLEAKLIADNPVCERPPITPRPPTTIVPVTDPSCVNATCTTPNVTTPDVTTQTPTTQSPSTTTTMAPIEDDTEWYLEESVIVFDSGDVFKEVVAVHDNLTDAYRGLLVITCCASDDINLNPQYTNLSAALLMVVDIAQDINIPSFSDNSNLTDETVFPNPAYVELGPCNCDLTLGHCDVTCCCDKDCSDDDIDQFTCLPDIPGGDFTDDWEYSCNNTDIFRPDWFPFMCVETINKIFLGYYFPSDVPGARDNQEFQSLQSNVPTDYTTFEEDENRDLNPSSEFSGSGGYTYGAPVQLLYDDSNIGLLALPQQGSGSSCLWSSSVKYQIDSNSTCRMNITSQTCQVSSALNARLFVQSSSVAYPPCPDAPEVIGAYGYVTGTESVSMVEYYCLDDLTDYVASTEKKSSYGLYTLSLPFVYGKKQPTYSRCVWDDDFSKPPEPNYNSTAQTCDNSVVDVQYEIVWSGGEILLLKSNVYIGSVPVEPSGTQLYPQYSVKFTHEPPLTFSEETGGVEITDEEFRRSGNPGYQVGELLLSGVSVYNEVNISTPNPTCNDSVAGECDSAGGDLEFVLVDTSSSTRLKYIASGPSGLCEDSTYEDITFGEDLSSGCIYRVGLSQLDNCTLLQQDLESQLKAIVQGDRIAKIGNASSFNDNDWVTIFREPIEYEVPSTAEPYQERVNEVLESLIGTCFHMPVGVHLQILYADAGMVNGVIQQEVVAAKISYRTQSIELKCAGANSASCQQNSSGSERVQSFVLSNWVTYTKVPAVSPEPVILYFKGVDESLCRYGKCPEEAFYPITRAFLGDSYEYSLAVWLTLMLFGFGYVVVTKPWI